MSRAVLLTLLLLTAFVGWAQPEPTPLPRDVTHAVTDFRGNPVPDARVTATYYLDGDIVYRAAIANAKGNVTWKALPAVRVIVWGDDVPAILLDSKTGKTGPLPPVETHPTVTFEVSVLGEPTGQATAQFWHQEYGFQRPFVRSTVRDGKAHGTFAMSVPCAKRCSALVVMPGTPVTVAILDDAYIPYIDEPNAKPRLTLIPRRMATVTCRFQQHGKPVPVSRLEVLPVAPRQAWPDAPAFREALAQLMVPRRTPDGYRLQVPGPGRYRLLVDLYDETTPPLPGSVFDVPEDGAVVEVELPAPLFVVPAGAEVNWVTRNAPARPERFTAAADNKPMPVFGPHDGIYAAWFRSAPDVMQLYHGATGRLAAHPLVRSTIAIDADGGATSLFNSIAPLLFRDVRLTHNISDMADYDAAYQLNSHLMGKRLEFGRNDFPFIWAGKYLLMYASQYRVLELAEGKPGVVTWAKHATPGGLRAGLRYLMINTPKEPPPVTNVQNAAALVFVDDERVPRGGNVMLRAGGGTNFAIPIEAKTLTFYAPGIGIIRNVPVPPVDDPNASVMLREWQPGVAAAGQVLDEADQPLTNAALRLIAEFEHAGMPQCTTDAQGKFRFTHLLPGMYFVVTNRTPQFRRSMDARDWEPGREVTWTLRVPEEGLTDARLTMRDGIRVNTGGHARSGLWWFPAQGAPMRLSAIDQALYCGLTLGDGMFWFKENYDNVESRLRRAALRPGPGMLAINDDRTERAGSYLGLYVALKGDNYFPGDIDLIGLEDRAGFAVRFDGNRCWNPSPELGFTAAQLGPLPTGKYRVTIGAGKGQIGNDVVVSEYGGHVMLP